MGRFRKTLRKRLAVRGERGANLVEFALIAPLLVLLLLGVIEFGWGLAQQIDVRHKAREGLRILIVDAPESEIQARICNDDIVDGSNVDSIELSSGFTVGSAATVTVEANVEQITGLFGLFWGPSARISSTVEGRVEQETTSFASSPHNISPPCP